MNTRCSKLVRFLSVLWLIVWAVAPRAAGQTPPSLGLRYSAGHPTISLTGEVGTVYSIQYASGPSQTNQWVDRTLLQAQGAGNVWTDPSAPTPGARFYRAVSVAAPADTNLVFIQPGTFRMGSPISEALRGLAEVLHLVTISRGFWMEKFLVTQGEYLAVIGSNPSYFRNGTDGTNSGGTGDTITNESLHPVEMVSWNDAVNYCARLTAQERNAGRLPLGWLYRLPTEAEWEYACRGGTTTAFHYGPALRSGMANFDGVYEYDSALGTTNNPGGIFLGRTTLVGSYEANGWGLYDMHGNVREWCADVWDGYGLPGGRVIDPQGPATGSAHVV